MKSPFAKRKSENDFESKLTAIRQQIATMQAETVDLENTAPTEAEIAARAKSEVDALASRFSNFVGFTPFIRPTFEPGDLERHWRSNTTANHSVIGEHISSYPPPLSVIHLLAAVVPDKLTSVLVAQAKATLGEGIGTLPLDQRQARAKELVSKISTAELEEERLCRVIDEARGELVDRRVDAPVHLLLMPDEELQRAA